MTDLLNWRLDRIELARIRKRAEYSLGGCDFCSLRQSAEHVIVLLDEMTRFALPRIAKEYHEDYGPVLWWSWPVCEPPRCGTPLDSDWPFGDLENCDRVWTLLTLPREPL